MGAKNNIESPKNKSHARISKAYAIEGYLKEKKKEVFAIWATSAL
jgi:hypothetical protein